MTSIQEKLRDAENMKKKSEKKQVKPMKSNHLGNRVMPNYVARRGDYGDDFDPRSSNEFGGSKT